MREEVFYKYRGLDNFEFFADIILNKRLYAAQFQTLNDPMEGHYYYSMNEDNEKNIDKWVKDFFNQKQKHRICSLSKDDNNMLMWSHYANSHRGVCIGVTVEDSLDIIHSGPVTYLDDLPTLQYHSTPQEVLMKKLKAWNYEREHRVISTDQFVKISVKEIIFGSRCTSVHKKIVRAIVEKYSPEIILKN
ncbi:DUF2971 domain-containing protein [Halobacteriovorax sp. JY17]|uniref:DUF2971 domain-containing protein n=1 Tax=Halobacteriovorax sp. JY17 TaxID=2014617 RepID=UPI000C449A61|nr:DUF2971 domain-containing protein [Halobacteriovorax sp. JY17]PIK14399.1 MAG: hypothetical protein CES88_08635 [Halobacteriovorax sp. JY17]